MTKQQSKEIKLNFDISNVYNRLSRKNIWYLVLSFLTLILLCVIDLCVGNSDINITNMIIQAFTDTDSTSGIIIWNLRLPHVLCALFTGAVLGISGCLLQSSLGNPLASPSTIGISQGAACGACFSIILIGGSFFGGKLIIVLFSFLFSLIPIGLIYLLTKIKHLNKTGIILTGVAFSIFFSGLIALIEYFADSSKVAEVVFWTFGSVQDKTYNDILIIAIVLIAILTYSIFNYMNLNAFECGDNTAHNIGINTNKARLRHLIIAALSAGCVTAFCGTINFIGLIAPHIMRKIISANYKYLIVASAVCGSCLLVLSDILSASLDPGIILPIGAITSMIGAPIFIWILIKEIK